jgi:hypothetical protein
MRPRLTPLLLLAALLLALAAPPAAAELTPAEWKDIQREFAEVYAQPGFPAEKARLLERLLEDGQSRSLKLIGDALVKECQIVWEVRAAWQQVTLESLQLLDKLADGYTKEEERDTVAMPARLKAAEEALVLERAVLLRVLEAVKAAPPLLRDTLYKRARTSKEWTYRAAAARLAVMRLPEPESAEFLRKTMTGDKDYRVRSATLEAIGDLNEGWETWALDRLGDEDWAVQLQAVQLVGFRMYKPAVPHLINALSQAGPRLAMAIGKALQDLTGENFEPFADVWVRWWEEHREEFESTEEVKARKQEVFEPIHFYGLPIKSDRIIFVIDVSDSMKHRTENGNPAEKWKPPAEVTGGKSPPPPPPPEEILSGPKIDVAKHELKKALEKLPSDTKFTIIAFNSGVSVWKDQLVAATDSNKQDAFTWVRALKPYSVTYVEGALRRAFQIAGVLDVDDKYPHITADTIVVLSDGAPTDNHPRKVSNADPEALLALVREWNKGQKVVIHAIGVDMIDYIDFLKKLAEQNGGTYVDR